MAARISSSLFRAVGLACDGAKGGVRLLYAILLDEPAGTFGNKAETDDEGECGNSAGAEHPAPCRCAGNRQRPVGAVSQQHAGDDGDLIQRNDAAALLFWRNFRQVKGRDGGGEADAEAAQEACQQELGKNSWYCGKDGGEQKERAAKAKNGSAAVPVAEDSGGHGSEKAAIEQAAGGKLHLDL